MFHEFSCDLSLEWLGSEICIFHEDWWSHVLLAKLNTGYLSYTSSLISSAFCIMKPLDSPCQRGLPKLPVSVKADTSFHLRIDRDLRCNWIWPSPWTDKETEAENHKVNCPKLTFGLVTHLNEDPCSFYHRFPSILGKIKIHKVTLFIR